jgi:amidase
VTENFPRTVGGREMETYIDWVAPTFVLSMTGLPVASVPAGLDSAGLPVGMQIVAPPQGEERALATAAIVQRLRPLPRPPVLSRPG